MNTPMEMPMMTPVDKELLDAAAAGGEGAAVGDGEGTGGAPVPAIHLICSPHFRHYVLTGFRMVT